MTNSSGTNSNSRAAAGLKGEGKDCPSNAVAPEKPCRTALDTRRPGEGRDPVPFPRYPKYKDSGVEWLGEVPAEWPIVRLKDFAQVINGYPFDSKLFDSDGAYPLIRIRDLNREETETRFNGEPVPEAVVTSADVLIGMDGDFNVGRWRGCGDALLNQRMCCIRAKDTSVSTVLYYALSIPLKAINDITYATTVKHLSSLDVGNIRLAMPEGAGDRLKLAAFLDRETGKIDALIAEQERLIALLKEKRQALISHAVTKGLDPNASMKDSGIEWLGQVPAHWGVAPIKRLSIVKRGASPRPIDDAKYFDVGGKYAWVRISDVSSSDGVLADTTQRLSELGSSLSVKLAPGSLFVSIAGTVGKPCITGIDACIHDGFVYFPTLKLDPKFLYRIFEAGSCYAGLGKFGTQLNLNTDTIGSISIAVPPHDEMLQILNYLDGATGGLNALIGHAQRAIDLLGERRATLISAAVTGKIDVRGA